MYIPRAAFSIVKGLLELKNSQVKAHISHAAPNYAPTKKRPISSSRIGVLRLNFDLFEEV